MCWSLLGLQYIRIMNKVTLFSNSVRRVATVQSILTMTIATWYLCFIIIIIIIIAISCKYGVRGARVIKQQR